jgi:hypothetical protein
MPPSASSWSPTRTGENTPGNAIDAVSASTSGPDVNATASAVSRSVVMAANGIGRSRKSRTSATGQVRRASSCRTLCAGTSWAGSWGRMPRSGTANR